MDGSREHGRSTRRHADTPTRSHIWLQAARPKTLWAAFAPVLIGSAMAYADGYLHLPSVVAALVAACLIQIGTNFANDYGDFKTGADAQDRKGPLRATQAGLVTPRAMLAATVMVFATAFATSLYLVVRGGWPVLLIGVLAIASGLLYTLGPRPLGYLGLGDGLVLIFFGPVAVGGTYYAQALTCPPVVLVAGLAPGLLAVAILVVNNLRDMAGDARVGKRTLAVRFGADWARAEYVICVLAATVGIPAILYGWNPGEHERVVWASVAALCLAPSLRVVWNSRKVETLNPVLGETALGLLIYSVMFAVGWVL